MVMDSFTKEMRQAENDYHHDPNSEVKELSHFLKLLVTWPWIISLSKSRRSHEKPVVF